MISDISVPYLLVMVDPTEVGPPPPRPLLELDQINVDQI